MASWLFKTVQIPLADVDEMSFDGSGGGHHGADQVSAAAFPLAALEIAIRRAGAVFALGQDVIVHANAHAAAGIAPLEAGIHENLVEAFLLRLRFHAA